MRAGVVADKISVNTQAGYSGEGPNENAVALLGDNKTVICIMRRDSAVSARTHPDDPSEALLANGLFRRTSAPL